MAYAVACIEVVLDESERGAALFWDLVDAWDRPGLQGVESSLIPDVLEKNKGELRREFEKAAIEARQNVHKPWAELMELATDADWWHGMFDGLEEEGKREALWTGEEQGIADLLYLSGLVQEFVVVGFNRESSVANDKLKVAPSTKAPWLLLGVLFRSAWEHYELSMEKLGSRYKAVQFGRKTHDLEDVMANQPTSRLHRDIVDRAQLEHLILRNDKKFLDAARLWYQCRVVYPGIEKYLDAEDAKGGARLDIKNVQKKIRPCDHAVGYERRESRGATDG